MQEKRRRKTSGEKAEEVEKDTPASGAMQLQRNEAVSAPPVEKSMFIYTTIEPLCLIPSNLTSTLRKKRHKLV